MNEPSKIHTVIVGLFIFIGIAFLLTGILIVGNLRETFNRNMKVVSLFDDVGGLQRGNNIWLSGVKIGTVDNLNFYGKFDLHDFHFEAFYKFFAFLHLAIFTST